MQKINQLKEKDEYNAIEQKRVTPTKKKVSLRDFVGGLVRDIEI